MIYGFRISAMLNAIVLAIFFPVSIMTLMSVKFWVCLILLVSASYFAERHGANLAKKGLV